MARRLRSILLRTVSLCFFDRLFLEHSREYGGIYNGHAHLDRSNSSEDVYLSNIETTPLEASSLPLTVKQNLVGDLHRGLAYTADDLRRRMAYTIRTQINLGVTRFDTNIDATPDLPEDGLLAIRIALELKREFRKKIKIRIAPTPIFGFKEGMGRWEVFEAAAKMCDYLSLLPEKDDYVKGSDPDGRIGFKQHIRRGLELGCKLGKEVQFHLDQANIPGERGTEQLLDVLEVLDQPKIAGDEPSVWVVHAISPSAYLEERFARLIDRLLDHNIGIIVCPSAALSMRQLRSIESPTHNSIARVLELIKKKVPVRMGTDNIADVFVPSSDGDMLTEVKIASNAVRLYQPSIWAKLACGVQPNNVDIATVGRILYEDRKACIKMNPVWQPAIE